MNDKIKLTLASLFFVGFMVVMAAPTMPVIAQDSGETNPDDDTDAGEDDDGGGETGSGLLRNVEFDAEPTGSIDDPGVIRFEEDGAGQIYDKLVEYVNFASIGVGVVAGFGAVITGIQYSMSRGEPAKTAAAVERMRQIGIAMVLYIFGLVIINWLVPGGVLNDTSLSDRPADLPTDETPGG